MMSEDWVECEFGKVTAFTLGGRGKMFQLFGNDMNEIINELNQVLAA